MDDDYLKSLIKLASQIPQTQSEALKKLKKLNDLVGNRSPRGGR